MEFQFIFKCVVYIYVISYCTIANSIDIKNWCTLEEKEYKIYLISILIDFVLYLAPALDLLPT